MNRILMLALMALIICCSKPSEYDIVIKNVSLFDGYEDHGIVTIAINSDTIAAISSQELLSDSVIDGSGKFIIPGLVNAHVHAASIEHLKQGYELGIMYLLNMHTGLEAREQEWKKLSRDSIGYSILYGSGHAATVSGGHPNQFSPEMETIGDSVSIEQWVDNRIAQNVDYIKIVRDNHEWMGYPPLPTLEYQEIGGIIDYASSNGYQTVIHANTVDEVLKIANYKPSGFVHMLDYKEDLPVPDEYYKVLADNNIFVVTTGGMSIKSMDEAPPFVKEWVNNNLLNASERAEIIGRMFNEGILIVAGTDAQDGQMNFSDDYFLELELYERAGLPNLEILKAATGNAAKAFDLPIGVLKIGSQANFVLLDENPLDDISNLKTVNQVWKNGKIR